MKRRLLVRSNTEFIEALEGRDSGRERAPRIQTATAALEAFGGSQIAVKNTVFTPNRMAENGGKQKESEHSSNDQSHQPSRPPNPCTNPATPPSTARRRAYINKKALKWPQPNPILAGCGGRRTTQPRANDAAASSLFIKYCRLRLDSAEWQDVDKRLDRDCDRVDVGIETVQREEDSRSREASQSPTIPTKDFKLREHESGKEGGRVAQVDMP
ncbi:hypothetical protein R3P38DRAFT_3360614 [Favolaschia claudopus]|uniref:Uncharacterized protein n=1 Tax=Favolaschia claudopus TaxID=2862362 RepID=A0AAW0AX94_9AGAR